MHRFLRGIMPLLLPISFILRPAQLTLRFHFLLYPILHFFSNAPYRMAISDSFFFSSLQIQSKTVAQCVEYYYSCKKEHKLANALAQVSGKKINSCREGPETGRRGQNLPASHARRRSARITSSLALGKAQQMLPKASWRCCSEIGNSGA